MLPTIAWPPGCTCTCSTVIFCSGAAALQSLRETRTGRPFSCMAASGTLIPRQHDVGPTRQVFAMEPEAVAHCVEKPPHPNFRYGVLALDGLHYAPPLFRAACVHRIIMAACCFG